MLFLMLDYYNVSQDKQASLSRLLKFGKARENDFNNYGSYIKKHIKSFKILFSF